MVIGNITQNMTGERKSQNTDPLLLEGAAHQTTSERKAALLTLCQAAVGKLLEMITLLCFFPSRKILHKGIRSAPALIQIVRNVNDSNEFS